MASVVFTPMAGLSMAALGLPPLLAPGRLPAGLRPIPLAPVAAAADRERPTALTAGSAMKHRDLAHWHASSSAGALDNHNPVCEASTVGLGFVLAGRDRGTEAPAPTGAFVSSAGSPKPIPPAPKASPPPTRRAARGMMICFGRNLDLGIRPISAGLPTSPPTRPQGLPPHSHPPRYARDDDFL